MTDRLLDFVNAFREGRQAKLGWTAADNEEPLYLAVRCACH